MADQMGQDFPSIPPERYCVTRHGVDIQKWMPDPNRKFVKPGPNRILSIGRLTFNKGFDILLKAVAIVKHRGIPFQLRIAGSGPERPRLEALIRELDLSADVVLLGAIGEEECLAEAQSADLFVLASHKEPLGVVYLEAMAAEVATIGTAAGGVVEIITDQVNGLLVPPDQVEALAEAITRLLTDDRLRQQLAKAGRQTVIERFDSRIGAAALYDLIMRSAAADQSLDKI
jgi:glycosyltransferase involved in cell wall biosynthesis